MVDPASRIYLKAGEEDVKGVLVENHERGID